MGQHWLLCSLDSTYILNIVAKLQVRLEYCTKIKTATCIDLYLIQDTYIYYVLFVVPSSSSNFALAPVASSPTQLSASWSAPLPKNGIITGYSVYCNTSGNQSYPEQVIGSNMPTVRSLVNGTTLVITLLGLNPYTQYSCYMTANASEGEGSPSNIVTVQTAQSGSNLLCTFF